MKAVTVIIGVLLIGAGVYCFVNIKAAFISLAFILGLVMMAYGVSQIVTWFTTRKESGSSAWVLGEGILTTLIGALVCFYPFQTDLVLAIWFAAWLIVSGIMRIAGAVQIRKNFPGTPWGLMLIMGVICILVGIYGLVHPLVAGMAIAMLLGIFFILQGINCLVFGINIPGVKSEKSEE